MADPIIFQALKEIAEAHARELAAITAKHQTDVEEAKVRRPRSLLPTRSALANAGLEAGLQEYFANITSQSKQLEREKQRAESVSELSLLSRGFCRRKTDAVLYRATQALERDRQSNMRTKLVLNGLAEAVKALDPPLPCTICAALFSNLDRLGRECHIP